jgi:ketosteroid isomerase-like protein
MSRQNVDVLRRMLQAFNNGDLEAFVAECDPAVEWEEQSIPGVEPLYRGRDGVRRSWAAVVVGVGEEVGPIGGRLEGVKETDDTVIASVRFEGEGRSSGG